MSAVNSASDASPSWPGASPSAAIWIGPPMFDRSIWRETSFQSPLAVSTVMSHVLTVPCQTAVSGLYGS